MINATIPTKTEEKQTRVTHKASNMQPVKLNLGCGKDIKEGWINVDINPRKENVIKANFNELPLMWEDNSIDEIYCGHLLIYLEDPMKFLYELHRICRPDAKIKMILTHLSFPFNAVDFKVKHRGYSIFVFEWMKQFDDMFRVIEKKINFTRRSYTWLNKIINPLINFSPLIYERIFCYCLPASEVIFDLEVIK